MTQIKSILCASLAQLNHLYYTTDDAVYLRCKSVVSLDGLSGIRVTADYVDLEYEPNEPVRLGKDGAIESEGLCSE